MWLLQKIVHNFEAIARPLHDMLKKDSFLWTADQTRAFQALKQALVSAPVLALPNFSFPFILETDASGTGLGVVMMQQGRPIAYHNSTLGPKNAAFQHMRKKP